MNLPASKRLFGLDVLRSTAIVLVLLSHTSFIFPVSAAGKSFIFIFCGFIGVELFFVLSGYLIGAILLKLITDEEFTWQKLKLFWIRRWFRTLPAYYLVLLLTVLFYYFISRGFVLNDWYNWLYFIFGQNFFAPHPSFFTVAWSLSIEEWFYLLLPITFYFSRKRLMYHKRITMIILAWIFLITLLRIAIVYTRNPSWDFGIRMMVPFRLDSLMTGVLAAWVKIRFSNVWSRYTKRFFYAGVLMLVICSWWLYIDVIRTDIKAGFFSKTFLFNFFSLGVALCLPFLAGIPEPGNKYIARPVHFVSYISYSLYLTHSIVIYVCVAVCNKFKILPAAAPRLLFVFAILLVVLYHNFTFLPFLNYGWLGVDLFFVLSGFLITQILVTTQNAKNYFKNFYARRVLRIFPVYYLALLLFLVILPLLPAFPIDMSFYQQHQLWYWTYLQNWMLIFHYNDNANALNHFWSLAVEEQFYLIWPFIIVFIRRPKILLAFCLSLLVAVILARLMIWNNRAQFPNYKWLFLFTRIDGILIGSMLALIYQINPASLRKYSTAIIFALAAFNFGIYFIDKEQDFPIWAIAGYSSFSVIFALLVYESISADSKIINQILNTSVLRFLGTYAYGFYIFHWPVFLLVKPYTDSISKKIIPSNSNWYLLPSAIMATLAGLIVAVISYHLFEKHFLKLKKYFG